MEQNPEFILASNNHQTRYCVIAGDYVAGWIFGSFEEEAISGIYMLYCDGGVDRISELALTVHTAFNELFVRGDRGEGELFSDQVEKYLQHTVHQYMERYHYPAAYSGFYSFAQNNAVVCGHLGTIRYTVLGGGKVLHVSDEHTVHNFLLEALQEGDLHLSLADSLAEVEPQMRKAPGKTVGYGHKFSRKQFVKSEVDWVVVQSELEHKFEEGVKIDSLLLLESVNAQNGVIVWRLPSR